MDVISRRISLTAWGRLYGFDKATTSRMHHAGRLFRSSSCPMDATTWSCRRRTAGALWYTPVCLLPTRRKTWTGRSGGSSNGQRSLPTRRSRKGDRFRFEWQPSPFAASGGGPHGEHDRGGASGAVVPVRLRICGSCAGWTGGSHSASSRMITEVMTSLCARLYGRRRRAERALAAAREA